jgi:hypothetical protein
MQDDFTPERFSLCNALGEHIFTLNPDGEWVSWTNFLVAKQSREHWKSKAERWEQEAQNQERCIQNVENLLCDSHKDADALRAEIARLQADVKRLTSIIDHNTSDNGRDLRQVTEDNIRLRQTLADICSIASKPV